MKRVAQIVGGIVLAVLLLASFYVDVINSEQGGAIDLRNRITGARLFAHRLDPYHYKWHTGDPPEYCDPFNNLALKVSKVTATPASLLLHLPLAMADYRTAQFTWLVLQWLLLLGTAAIWIFMTAVSWPRWLVAIFTTGFTYTAGWRLHAERGQVYVLLLFVLAGWLALTLHPRTRNGFVAGLVAGLLGALRPPFLLLIPFLALHRRGQLAGAAVGLALGVVLPLFFNASIWSQYASGMQGNVDFYTKGFNPWPPGQAFPGVIEGMLIDHLAHFAPIPFADFSVHALLHALGFVPFPDWPVTLAGVVPFVLWLWLSRKMSAEALLPGMAAWFFIIDLFLPAYRNSYNDVLILNVVALGVLAAARTPWTVWPCLLALPAGWYLYASTSDAKWLINLPSALFTATCILLLALPAITAASPVAEKRAGSRRRTS